MGKSSWNEYTCNRKSVHFNHLFLLSVNYEPHHVKSQAHCVINWLRTNLTMSWYKELHKFVITTFSENYLLHYIYGECHLYLNCIDAKTHLYLLKNLKLLFVINFKSWDGILIDNHEYLNTKYSNFQLNLFTIRENLLRSINPSDFKHDILSCKMMCVNIFLNISNAKCTMRRNIKISAFI